MYHQQDKYAYLFLQSDNTIADVPAMATTSTTITEVNGKYSRALGARVAQFAFESEPDYESAVVMLKIFLEGINPNE